MEKRTENDMKTLRVDLAQASGVRCAVGGMLERLLVIVQASTLYFGGPCLWETRVEPK